MKQILHINSNYLTSKLHENLLDRLETTDMHNTVYMPIKEETQKNFLYESKYEIYHPVAFQDMDKFIFTYKQRKIYQKLHQVINPKKYDVIHAHTLFTDGNVAYQLNKEYDIPYIVTVRGFTDINSFFKKRINLRKRGREILKNASEIIFLSETNRQELLNDYIKNESFIEEILNKSRILPNGIDTLYFENKGKPKKLDLSKPIKLIQVGQVKKLKNGLGSIKGIQAFTKKTGIKAELLFVGKIVEESYAKQIKEVGSGLVSYQPQVGIEELINIYRESDIYIMPSFSETFGLVYPEAMSQGLPIIYTKNQGFDGQFEDGYVGYPVQADEPEDISQKLEWLVENYEELSQNALEAFQKFNWDNLAQNYVTLYSKIANGNED